MTLIKSLLLGSAAGIVAVATAQAADLPTRKAAPVEYVRVCNVGGITGWTLPGSDTCVKFSGYMTAHSSAVTSIPSTPGALLERPPPPPQAIPRPSRSPPARFSLSSERSTLATPNGFCSPPAPLKGI